MELTPHQKQIIRIMLFPDADFNEKFVWPYYLWKIKKIGTAPNIRICLSDLKNLDLIERKSEGDER